MFRAKFIYNFFHLKQNNSNAIIRFTPNRKLELQAQINTQLIELDQKIAESGKALLEAQIVKLRSTVSKSNNFIEKIGQNVYKKKIDDSINWHQKELKELYLRRKNLQINLEKIKGTYWLNRIKRFLIITLISFFILLSLFIFLSGFMIMIYLLPLFIFIFLGYSLVNKKY